MRILLTGAAGALGTAAGAALAAAGHTVRATDEAALGGGAPPAAAADYRRGVLTDPEFVATLLDGVEAIVHLAPLALVERLPAAAASGGGGASAEPAEVLDAAARGTHVLLKAATEAGIGLVVQGSTLAVMDAYDGALEVTEQWRPRPRPAPAALAPYLAELTAREFTRDVQLDLPPRIVCLRFDRLAGRDGGRPATADGPPALEVADAADAILRALAALQGGARQRGHRWQLYHVASPSPHARYTSAAARQALGYGAPEAT